MDLTNQPYCFPVSFACTDSQPDLVIWSKDLASIHLVELTVPFETTMEDAVTRKRARYSELLQECSRTAKVAKLITIEVGSRGFLNLESFRDLYRVPETPPAKDCHKLEVEVVKTTLLHSHQIRCKRNWREQP